MSFEVNAIRGVMNSYGPRTTEEKFGGQSSTRKGIVKEAIWEFSYNALPAYGTSGMQYSLPANTTIVSAKLVVDTAFTSTSTSTDLVIGLYQADGTVIDADGLVAAAQATQTAIGTAGNVVTGAGALVGATIGSAAGELVVAPTVDDLLTGAGRIVVEYILDR